MQQKRLYVKWIFDGISKKRRNVNQKERKKLCGKWWMNLVVDGRHPEAKEIQSALAMPSNIKLTIVDMLCLVCFLREAISVSTFFFFSNKKFFSKIQSILRTQWDVQVSLYFVVIVVVIIFFLRGRNFKQLITSFFTFYLSSIDERI